MDGDRTVPAGAHGVPVRSLRVELIGGPDTGRSLVTQSDAASVGVAAGNGLVLTDPTVSRYHLELSRHAGGVLVVDHGSTNGTFIGGVRIERVVAPAGTILRLGATQLRLADGDSVTMEVHGSDALGQLRGRTVTMRRLMAQIERASRSDVPVLVLGESGTGKELVARALHDVGSRKGRPFVTVDCGSLSPSLVASELFGHERGAFTGAERKHVGAFERADGGTVFLDEIGELPASLQPTLLGVLERRKLRRLGGQEEIAVDVRIVSATNRDLRAAVNVGTFRLDLYYRIAVVLLKAPPLRERSEDVPLLVEHFLRECGHDGPVESVVPPGAMKGLCAHAWPGNVRELRNVVEATIAMGEAPPLSVPHPGAEGAERSADSIAPLLELTYKEARAALLGEFEARYLARLLERAEGNVTRAARLARIDRSHLNDLLQRRGGRSG